MATDKREKGEEECEKKNLIAGSRKRDEIMSREGGNKKFSEEYRELKSGRGSS